MKTKFHDRIRLITLDNPFIGMQRKEVKELFSEVIALRARGYGVPFYPPNLLPFEANDFISWHHLICLEDGLDLRPVASYKTISFSRCQFYYTTAPYFELAKESSTKKGLEALEQVVKNATDSKKDVLLASGFTIDPPFRGRGSSLAELIKEVVAALMAYDSEVYQDAPLIGGGVPRYKTEKLWELLGYDFLKDENGLPITVEDPAVGGMEVLLMCAENVSEWARSCLKKHSPLIDQRMIYQGRGEEDPFKGQIAA